MTNLKPITDEILADARQKAAEIKRQNERDISAKFRALEAELSKERAEFEKELKSELSRRHSLTEVDKRRLLKTAEVTAKTGFVKSAFATARAHLASFESREYFTLLSILFENAEIPSGSTIYLNARDKARIGGDVFNGAKISAETIDSAGGFIAVCGKITYNCTIESLFEENYSEICDRIRELCREVQA